MNGIKGVFLCLVFGVFVSSAWGQDTLDPAAQPKSMNNLPSLTDLVKVVDQATAGDEQARQWSTPVRLVLIFSGLAILPSLLVMMTSFTRIVIVLSFARRALGTQSIPPTMAVMGLALFLTLFTMTPTFTLINETSIRPYLAGDMELGAAGVQAGECLKGFMLRQCREADLALFIEMARVSASGPADLGMNIVVPAFIISEFRTGFEIGCLLFIPFLVVDLVISSVLLSAGMMMLPPVMISLPFKLILFILVDGWGLLAKSLSLGFN
jgi:flagellar biosynthetic protein FliP